MATALVVGTSRGLGRAIAIELLGRGWNVIATVRRPSDSEILPGSERLRVELLETTDWQAADALRERLDGQVIDLIFVVAAIPGDLGPIGNVDPQGFEEMMRVNVLAPLRLVDRFAALVPASGTMAVMSSSLGSIGLNESAGIETYRMTKAALNMGMKSLSIRRAQEGRTYLAVDPGWVRTDMGGPDATLSISESITPLVDMLEARSGQGGMSFVNYQNHEHPW